MAKSMLCERLNDESRPIHVRDETVLETRFGNIASMHYLAWREAHFPFGDSITKWAVVYALEQ